MEHEEESKPDIASPKKFERAFDSGTDLARRRPLLAIAFALVVLVGGGVWAWDHLAGRAALREQREEADRERGRAVRERDDALRAKEEVTRERDKYFTVYTVVQSAADARFTNAAPDKRIDLLLDMVRDLREHMPRSRLLSAEALARIKRAFSEADKSVSIEVECGTSGELASDAKMLERLMRSMGFPCDLSQGVRFGGALMPLSVQVSSDLVDSGKPSASTSLKRGLGEGILALYVELGISPAIWPMNGSRAGQTNIVKIVFGD